MSHRISGVIRDAFLVILIFLSGCEKDGEQSVNDNDGNVYHVVTIGNQVWMVENLKSTHYRNGDPVLNVTEGAEWDNLSAGAYCDIDNQSSNASIFGHLYNWYAVNDSRHLCHEGWHVPTDDEW